MRVRSYKIKLDDNRTIYLSKREMGKVADVLRRVKEREEASRKNIWWPWWGKT